MPEICMSGSMSGVWKRSQGRTSEAPPNERGGNRYVRPTATAPHLDSTRLYGSMVVAPTAGIGASRPFGLLESNGWVSPSRPFATVVAKILTLLTWFLGGGQRLVAE